jgi:ParB/RepB/Spo0J family partition protein
VFFGKQKTASAEKKPEMEGPKQEIKPKNPYDDEPAEWKQYPGEKQALAWYQEDTLWNHNSSADKPTDGTEFLQWYLDAASQGNTHAEYALGKMYGGGVNVPANPFQAGLWYSHASKAGSPFASYELAKMCEYGIGMKKDKETSGKLYREAYEDFLEIEKQSPCESVELKLAVICENKLASGIDLPEAGKWRQKAGSAKNPKEPGSASQSHSNTAPSVQVTEPKVSPAIAKYQEIPAKYIVPSPYNPYAENDSDDQIREMAASIQVHGLISPLVLNQVSEEKYCIIAGERRYKAITQYLHWTMIPAIVHKHMSENASQLMLHAANLEVREYSAGEKLRFYTEAERQIRKMITSGEYSGTVQQGISKLLGLSVHQIHKYKTITENLPKRKLKQVRDGSMSIERAYRIARTTPKKVSASTVNEGASDTGRTSGFKEDPGTPETPECTGNPGESDTGRTSGFKENPGTPETPECTGNPDEGDAGRTSGFKENPGTPEIPECEENPGESDAGRTSGFEEDPGTPEIPECKENPGESDTGRTSGFKEDPGTPGTPERTGKPEANDTGRTSGFKEDPGTPETPECAGKPEANDTGRTSGFKEKPGTPETPECAGNPGESDTGRTSGFEKNPGTPETPECAENPGESDAGRTSGLKDPSNYQDALDILRTLPAEPEETCAVLEGGEITCGQIERFEIYANALLISVSLSDIRRPYPVSEIGKTLFIGPDCYREAKAAAGK